MIHTLGKQVLFQKSNQNSEHKNDWRYAQVKIIIPETSEAKTMARYTNVTFTFIGLC